MTDTVRYIVAYDIADDRERASTANLLEGYGFRRQKSLFECRLTRGQLARLQRELTGLAIETGFVIIYHVAANALPLTVGEVPHFPDDDWAFIV